MRHGLQNRASLVKGLYGVGKGIRSSGNGLLAPAAQYQQERIENKYA